MSRLIENEDGTVRVEYSDKDFAPADLPEAGASAERISSVIYSPAMTVEFNCKKCGEKVVREKVSEDAMKIGYYKRLFKWCDKCRREWERSALKRLPVVLDAIGRDCI